MARTLFHCIGDWFQEIVMRQYPDLKPIPHENGQRPDLANDLFEAELKAGYRHYGAQLKEAQIDSLGRNGKRLVYMIGYHALHGLRESTKRMCPEEIDTLLRKEGSLHSAYVVSNSVIKALWRREHHTAQQTPDWRYFSIKPRHCEAIIRNNSFARNGVKHMPSRYYGIKRPQFLLQSAPLLNGTTLRFGAILERQADEEIIDYFSDREALG